MENPQEILTESVSTRELERRWKAVREVMRGERIDFLVMQNDNEWLGGYIKWFTDIPARNAYPMTVIFPVDDEMTTITSGGKPPGDLGPPAWTMRGVKSRLTAPYFRSLAYSNTYDADLALQTLKVKKKAKIGIVGKATMSAMFYDLLTKGLPEATFVDATGFVDEFKAVKSDEEISFLKKTVALQDEAIAYAKKVIKPGRRDFEIIADVVHKVTVLGSEEQLVIGASGPVGRPVPMQKRHFQNRTVREGDQFTLMIEVNGPGGMYAEIGRIFFLGKAPSQLQEAYELCKETQKVTLKLMKPGADPAEIWRANNEFLVKNGQLPETRLYAHGQGYDLVERPAIRDDEPMKLKARMNITVHPTIGSDKLWVWVCDNYLITDSGVSPCLHKTPQKIFEL
ncbi:MAG: M24 family metallopeptidase [Thermodesulfobacteriota bacterium]